MATAAVQTEDIPVIAPAIIERGLELVPIPSAHVHLVDGEFRFLAANGSYRRSGLGTDPATSALLAHLGGRIRAFLSSRALREEFEWTLGEAIDSLYYRVTFARSSTSFDDRCSVSLVDQTPQRRTEHSLRREMTTDSLTGLPNRAGFTDRLEAVMAHERARHAVLMVDLDRFNRVNACLGSMVGDELLITVARRLKGALRAHDLLARTGGDEFAILLTLDAGRADADHVAKRIRGALAAPFRLSDYETRIGCSIGIAFGSDAVDDAEELIRHAQFAVKRSKTSGLSECYQPLAFDRERDRFAMETALRRAIDGNALMLGYQPICDLASGQVVAFEALARWTGDDGRPVSPADFIPVAEESGLIVPLGRWAIHLALETLAQWDALADGDCGVQMSVNLSPIQLQRDDIPALVERALDLHAVPGHRLKLELTESALVVEPERVAATLDTLKALGVSLVMDDFGTGYSNLASLQKLPIDLLKIDRSLVTNMLADRDKVAIVRATLGLAQALNMQTVAEGIETADLGQTLAALGCTFGQGWLYGRALPDHEAYALLANA